MFKFTCLGHVGCQCDHSYQGWNLMTWFDCRYECVTNHSYGHTNFDLNKLKRWN